MTETTSIISLAELKAHLNVTTDTDDAVLGSMLETARGFVEGWCGLLDGIEGGVPHVLKHAMKLYAGHLYENREATTFASTAGEVPLGFFDLIAPYRRWNFGHAED